ncbi:hypothetical protein VTG60DRAFT_5784 [Thermothelomyces hinnuleus]
MYSFDALFECKYSRTETNELVFRVEMPGLLSGNLTHECAEQQAVRLLNGLVSRQSEVVQAGRRRAIIWVAYDLGSLVVKLALTLAARSPDLYPGIVASTSHIVKL